MFLRKLSRRMLLGTIACVTFAVSGSALSDDILFGANKQAQVSEINLTQLTFSVAGTLSVGTAAADQDPETGRLYYFEMNADGENGDTFNYWDSETGTATVVQQYFPPPGIYVKRMAFAPDGTLYMSDDDNILYTVDKAPGDITTLGPVLGFNSGPAATGGESVAPCER